MARRAAEVDLARQVHIVEVRAVGVDLVADIDVGVEDDVRQLAVAVGDGRHRDRAICKVDLP